MAGFKMLPWDHLQVPYQHSMLFNALSLDLKGSCKWSGKVYCSHIL